MTAEAILAMITALTSAIPQLATLVYTVKNSGSATPADVLAILNKCGVDRAVFMASIAASEAVGK